ncbi:hypothetical protein AB1Y20_013604 [Prymnesium parvum]|uniref:Choline monooxygenase, chloroplastic n=1 Tax=Prymnesium parvum TaxID=97485 RepID=A0AB34IGR8_PRYPA
MPNLHLSLPKFTPRLTTSHSPLRLARRPLSTATSEWSDPMRYARTRLPVDEATTLPGAVYHDEAFFQLEKKNVFHSSWVAAAELVDLQNPGDVVPTNIGGAPVLLVNDKGVIRAFHNVCRHRGAQLVHDKCSKRSTILCPYHRWGYALDGRLVGTPSFDDDPNGKRVPEKLREKFRTNHVKDFDKNAMGLHPVRVDCALGLAFVNLNGEAPALREWFGDLLPEFDDFDRALSIGNVKGTHRKVYDIAANWKVLMENYLEYYHLPAVHPDLCKVSGVDEHCRFQGSGMYMAFCTDPLTVGGTPLDPGRLPNFPSLYPHRAGKAYHVALFPNTFFSLYPDALFRVVLSPQSAGRTLEHATLMTHDGALSVPDAEAKIEELFAFWDQINTEDIVICETVQRGIIAPAYEGGRFSFRFEEPLHRFQNMVVDKMLPDAPTRYRIPVGDVVEDLGESTAAPVLVATASEQAVASPPAPAASTLSACIAAA